MDPAVSLNLNTTLGAFQIGVLVSYVLFGVTTTQTYIYYSRFPDDSSSRFWICEVGHTLCIGHSLYVYTISDYAHPERVLGVAPKSLETTSIFSGVIAACGTLFSKHATSVQGFFSFRIYAFSKKLYIPFLSWMMSVLRLLGCTVLFVGGLGMKSIDGYVVQWEWLASFVWSISTANDVMITATLVVLLSNQRDNVHTRTAALVEKLILWSIETGMLTSSPSATSIATLACGKYELNQAFISSLNSRATLRAMNDVSLPSLHWTPPIPIVPQIICDANSIPGEGNKTMIETI
ncbi:hypothetical protein B0H13DRAFT_1897672 [Mycena leptocephala]|nr:hypothetical protein B0H13DRAFT_1897672 [Mycena leptocephala]